MNDKPEHNANIIEQNNVCSYYSSVRIDSLSPKISICITPSAPILLLSMALPASSIPRLNKNWVALGQKQIPFCNRRPSHHQPHLLLLLFPPSTTHIYYRMHRTRLD